MRPPALIGLFFALACATVCLAAAWAHAAEPYTPGFRTLGEWQAQPALRLDINVWYPSHRSARELSYVPWTIRAARNAKAAEGRFPLLLLSHATPGTRFSYHTVAAWLASCGFVVAAPTHAGDCMDNMDDLFTWNQLARRVADLSSTLDILLADKELSASIDPQRVGLLGYGAGATAALLMGGALPDCASAWPGYCARAGAGDAYCGPGVRGRIDALCATFPLTRSLADQRIKAIAAVSPGYGMLFGPDSFRWFYPPLLLVAADRERIDRAELHARPLARLLGSRARILELTEADTGALMSTCPPRVAAELPELCLSTPPETRAALHRRLNNALADFFLHYLGSNAHVPVIAPPPDLTPPAPDKAAQRTQAAEPAAKQQKRRGRQGRTARP